MEVSHYGERAQTAILAPHSKHRAEVVPGHAPPPVEQSVAEQLPLDLPRLQRQRLLHALAQR